MPRGGARKGTGPKHNSARHGVPGNNSRLAPGLQRLTSFFGPSTRSNTASETIVTTNSERSHKNTEEEGDSNVGNVLEETITASIDHSSVAGSRNTGNSTETATRNQIGEETSSRAMEPMLQNPDLSSARMNGRSRTGIIDKQHKRIKEKNKINAGQIRNNVSRGIFRDRRADILHDHIKPEEMNKSWEKFHELDIVHWIPSIMLAQNTKQWMPVCPNTDCGNQCTLNGFNKDPRLCYGAHENYWINAPERYKCQECKDVRKIELDSGVPKESARQWEWHSLRQEIMEQVRNENEGLFNTFPCILSHINAVDKEVLKLVQDFAVRGVGPSAVADILLSWHEKRWQEKEIQWLCHLASRMENPIATVSNGRDCDLQSVEKMPCYFSEKCCGGTPGSSYLINTFNQSIDQNRRYYDEETVRRMKNSLMIAIDASFKVGRWMMRHGDQKIFEALHTGLNEYGEVIMQRWSTSDNHSEVEQHMRQLKDLGLQPWWVFSDVPEKDAKMLLEIFDTTLSVNVDKEAMERSNQCAAAKSNLALVPADLENCVYVTNATNAEALIHRFEQSLDECNEAEHKIIYFDTGESFALSAL